MIIDVDMQKRFQDKRQSEQQKYSECLRQTVIACVCRSIAALSLVGKICFFECCRENDVFCDLGVTKQRPQHKNIEIVSHVIACPYSIFIEQFFD